MQLRNGGRRENEPGKTEKAKFRALKKGRCELKQLLKEEGSSVTHSWEQIQGEVRKRKESWEEDSGNCKQVHPEDWVAIFLVFSHFSRATLAAGDLRAAFAGEWLRRSDKLHL